MKRVIKYTLLFLLSLILIYFGFRVLTDQERLMEDIDNISIKLIHRYIFKETNELNNYEEVLKVANNTDYKDSKYYPYYELLDEDGKTVYNQIKTAVNSYNDVFVPDVTIDSGKLKEVFLSFFYDHPEVFWLSIEYSNVVDENDRVVSVTLVYTDHIKTINDAKETFDKKVNEIVNEAKKQELDYAKVFFVHNKLIDMIEYDTNEYVDQSAFGAVNQRRAVCVGYAKLFQVIMMKLGIPTYYITGSAGNDYHVWNVIELEDGFYNIDLTWDDNSKTLYKYFLINNKSIEKDHKRDNMSSKLNLTNGTKYINKYSTLN